MHAGKCVAPQILTSHVCTAYAKAWRGGHLSLLRQSFAHTSGTAAAVGRFAEGYVARIAVALLRSSCGAAAEDVQGQ